MAVDEAISKRSAVFFDIHSGLPREAPGDTASTLRALKMASLPGGSARVLDIGCGPGMQTIDLARALPAARITALDAYPPFLADLARRAEAAGLGGRISTCLGDMAALPFGPGAFDLIWCEGAAYILGVEAALAAWAPFLKPQGRLAFTDAVWRTDTPSEAALEFWAEYPDMTHEPARRAQCEAAGYEVLGSFLLPPDAWWTHYYAPMETRLDMLEQRYENDDIAGDVLAEARREIETYRHHAEDYGYAFFVLKHR